VQNSFLIQWRDLTTHSTGLAIQQLFHAHVDSSPVNSSVRRLSLCEAMNLLGSVTISLVLLLAAYGQVADSLKVFDPVPANQRAHLAERLKRLVEYQRTKQYEKVFGMLPKVHTQHPELTKEEFLATIRTQGKAHVVDFIPEYTTENPTIDGEYAIYGCAKVREGRGTKKWQAATYASLEDGEWYFSDILFTFPSLHARNPSPCAMKKKR
jgi:hypothetical protein